MKLFKPTPMKALIIISSAALCLFCSCEKEMDCIGSDCVYPEAIVAIDSISQNHIYSTLITREGEQLVYALSLSPEINEQEFMDYTGYSPEWPTVIDPTDDQGQILKVYYVASNQFYVAGDAHYINACDAGLEIVAFGDDLILTY